MATLGAPKAVSPLIRVSRWTALVAGVSYGFFRYRYLERREVGIKAREDEIRARRDARLAREKAASDKAELDDLGREAGILPK